MEALNYDYSVDVQPGYLELMEHRIFPSNKDGDLCVQAYLSSPRVGNDKDQAITANLYSKGDGNGYLFELSPQLGCIANCNFCGCGAFRSNLRPEEVVDQVRILQEIVCREGVSIGDVNQISFTDGGELLLNPHCMEILEAVIDYLPGLEVKLSTVLPDVPLLRRNLICMMEFMQQGRVTINWQVSFHSTDQAIREAATPGVPLFSFVDIKALGEEVMRRHPDGRKITLSFTLMGDSHCDPLEIAGMLPPELFVIRLYPYKQNGTGRQCVSNEQIDEWEAQFVELGYKVIAVKYDEEQAKQLLRGGTKAL